MHLTFHILFPPTAPLTYFLLASLTPINIYSSLSPSPLRLSYLRLGCTPPTPCAFYSLASVTSALICMFDPLMYACCLMVLMYACLRWMLPASLIRDCFQSRYEHVWIRLPRSVHQYPLRGTSSSSSPTLFKWWWIFYRHYFHRCTYKAPYLIMFRLYKSQLLIPTSSSLYLKK